MKQVFCQTFDKMAAGTKDDDKRWATGGVAMDWPRVTMGETRNEG